MTYSISINGSMDNLDDESRIQDAAMDLIGNLSGVQSAMLNTTHGGSVNLLEPAGATNGEAEPAPGTTVEEVETTEPAEPAE